MAEPNYILSAEDIARAERVGPPGDPETDFVTLRGDTVELTPRGMAFYRHCLNQVRMPIETVANVRSISDWAEMTTRIRDARLLLALGDLQYERARGRVAPEDREVVDAMLALIPADSAVAQAESDDADLALLDVLDADDRRRLCREAGSNVIPVDFSRRRS